MVKKPKFQCGSWVYIEVEASVPQFKDIKFSTWVKLMIVGCNLKDSSEEPYWLYSLMRDPPAAYYPGTGFITGVSESTLHSELPIGVVEGEKC